MIQVNLKHPLNLHDGIFYKLLDELNLANQSLANKTGEIKFNTFYQTIQELEACLGHCQKSVVSFSAKIETAKSC